MMLTSLLLTGLLAAQENYKFDEFEAWNRFEAGASVTIEMETSGMKISMTTTLKSKDKDVLKVETKTKIVGNEMDIPPQEREIKKETAEQSNCPSCGKAADSHGSAKKTGTEKMKIGDQEIEVSVIEFSSSDCQGNAQGKGKMHVSDAVPGGLVKLETEAGGQKSAMACTAFSKGGK